MTLRRNQKKLGQQRYAGPPSSTGNSHARPSTNRGRDRYRTPALDLAGYWVGIGETQIATHNRHSRITTAISGTTAQKPCEGRCVFRGERPVFDGSAWLVLNRYVLVGHHGLGLDGPPCRRRVPQGWLSIFRRNRPSNDSEVHSKVMVDNAGSASAMHSAACSCRLTQSIYGYQTQHSNQSNSIQTSYYARSP